MANVMESIPHDQPLPYQIQVQGSLDSKWFTVFNGMTIESERVADGVMVTTLRGMVADQSALHGMLNHVRDLGLTLILVRLLETEVSQ